MWDYVTLLVWKLIIESRMTLGRYFFNIIHQFCWRTAPSCVLQEDLWAVNILLTDLRSNSQRTASLRLCRKPPKPYRRLTHSYQTDCRIVCGHIIQGNERCGCKGQTYTNLTKPVKNMPGSYFTPKLSKIIIVHEIKKGLFLCTFAPIPIFMILKSL